MSEEYARKYLIPNKFAEYPTVEPARTEKTDHLSEQESLDTILVLDEFRKQLYRGGARKWTVNGLNRVFDAVAKTALHRRNEELKSNQDLSATSLTAEDFDEAIKKFGVFLNQRAMQTLVRAFDRDGNGSIDYKEFMTGLRGPLSERRFQIIEKAWKKLSRAQETIHRKELENSIDVSSHPLVRSGEEDVNSVIHISLPGIDGDVVTKDDFFTHYTDISAVFDSDDMFVDMIEHQFGVRETEASETAKASLQGFKKAFMEKVMQRNKHGESEQRTLLRAFQVANSDSMGRITLSDFTSTVQLFGFDPHTAKQIFDQFDKSGDNQISYKEFIEEMTSS